MLKTLSTAITLSLALTTGALANPYEAGTIAGCGPAGALAGKVAASRVQGTSIGVWHNSIETNRPRAGKLYHMQLYIVALVYGMQIEPKTEHLLADFMRDWVERDCKLKFYMK